MDDNIEGAPSYIPEEYEIQEITNSETKLRISYINEIEKIILYTRYIGEVSLTVDNEDTNFDKITISSYEGYINNKNNEVTLIFHVGKFTYKIILHANEEETIKMAESIE